MKTKDYIELEALIDTIMSTSRLLGYRVNFNISKYACIVRGNDIMYIRLYNDENNKLFIKQFNGLGRTISYRSQQQVKVEALNEILLTL